MGNKDYKPWKNYGSRERDHHNSKLNLNPQETDELVDKLTDVYMKQYKEDVLNDPRKARPDRMREDPTTPLIHKVPFGPKTSQLLDPDNPDHYDHVLMSGSSDFDKFEDEQDKLPNSKQFPRFGDITGKGKKMEWDRTKGKEVDVHGWRVIPHGDISIPNEQMRKTIPFEKRDWENGRLKSKSQHNRQKGKDAEEIARELLLSEGNSRFVNKATGKIRPNKPVRSDYASIIHAERGFKGVVKKQTTFVVAEGNKPEFVEVRPLKDSRIKKC